MILEMMEKALERVVRLVIAFVFCRNLLGELCLDSASPHGGFQQHIPHKCLVGNFAAEQRHCALPWFP